MTNPHDLTHLKWLAEKSGKFPWGPLIFAIAFLIYAVVGNYAEDSFNNPEFNLRRLELAFFVTPLAFMFTHVYDFAKVLLDLRTDVADIKEQLNASQGG